MFQLFALAAPAVPDPDAPVNARPRAVLARVRGPVLARGRLTGIYQR